MALAVALALLAALLFAVAAVAQQRGTVGISDDDALGVGLLARLWRRPVWLVGMGADIGGFGVQAAALAVGSLLLVQPLLVTTVALALPMAAWANKRRLTGREWAWMAVLTVSLVVFLVLGEPTAGRDTAPWSSWFPVLVAVAVVVVVSVLIGSRRPHGTGRSLLLALAAGSLLGIGGPLTKTAVNSFDAGLLAGITTWEVWAMAACAAYGTFLQQSSYQAGDVQTSLPTVTILKPVVAMAIGITLFRETLTTGGPGDIVLVICLAAMAVATVALGRLAAPAAATATGG